MSETIVLRDVRIFDPGSGIEAQGRTVVVKRGLVADLDAPRDVSGGRIVDGRGAVLIPGLIDLRAHLCDPGFSRRETMKTGLRAAAAGGYTTVVALPTTEPTVDGVEVVELIKAKARAASPVQVLPAGALSLGRKGERLAEMANLSIAGCVLFTDADRAVRDSQLLRYAMETAKDLGLPIVTHAEDEGLSLGGVMHEGIVSTRLGLQGVPSAAEVVGVARDLAVAELTGARLHIAHVSTRPAIDLVRQAKQRGIRVTADASPLHLILTDDAVLGYDSSAKLFPPLRPQSDVDALVQGVRDGTIDAVASDHCPQTYLEKNVEFDRAVAGAVGLETTLSVLLGLVYDGQLTLERAVASVTRGPAQVLGRPDLGTLRVGSRADLVLIDLDREWLFDGKEARSRSTNTPLLGQTLRGKAILTIAGGQIAHDERAADGH